MYQTYIIPGKFFNSIFRERIKFISHDCIIKRRKHLPLSKQWRNNASTGYVTKMILFSAKCHIKICSSDTSLIVVNSTVNGKISSAIGQSFPKNPSISNILNGNPPDLLLINFSSPLVSLQFVIVHNFCVITCAFYPRVIGFSSTYTYYWIKLNWSKNARRGSGSHV